MNFKEIYVDCVKAGEEEMYKCRTTPMIVETHRDMFDDNSPVIKREIIEAGPCGFAWLVIKPTRSRFCSWLRENNLARYSEHERGVVIFAHVGGQSVQLKEAWTHGFYKELMKHKETLKITIESYSRLD